MPRHPRLQLIECLQPALNPNHRVRLQHVCNLLKAGVGKGEDAEAGDCPGGADGREDDAEDGCEGGEDGFDEEVRVAEGEFGLCRGEEVVWEAVDYAEEVDVSCCDSVLCLVTCKYGCY